MYQLSLVGPVGADRKLRLRFGSARTGLAAHGTEVLQLTPAISVRAADMVDSLALSNGTRLAAALVAATAIEHKLTLLSANAKHFGAIKELKLGAFMP